MMLRQAGACFAAPVPLEKPSTLKVSLGDAHAS
jgi:hypothetical protein